MTSREMSDLPAFRRQHLLAEFAGLKQACPEGVFVSLTPGDSSLWTGVLFIRKGPYSNAILRFQIAFPDRFPDLPPLVTFSTDMFHPLITPLTTYMYTTDIQDNGTVSASDEERLPPGGFSLRHGFPSWFGRKRGSRQTSGQQLLPQAVRTPPRSTTGVTSDASVASTSLSKGSSASAGSGMPSYRKTGRREVSTYEVLRYLRSTFDDEDVLDTVPLEAAGNPGAWHAWRTHRRHSSKTQIASEEKVGSREIGEAAEEKTDEAEEAKIASVATESSAVVLDAASPAKTPTRATGVAESGSASASVSGSATRNPGEWNWEGVWEVRVKKGIAASLSESVLFGNSGSGDDVIRFLSMDESDIQGVKDNLLRTLGASPPAPA